MKLLLDEMYPPELARALRRAGIEATTALELGLGGASDANLLATAASEGYVVLTENASDFARIAADRLNAAGHHAGVMIALSSRFSRRPAGIPAIAAAVSAAASQDFADRFVYLDRPPQ